jgi:hypothetical protein
MTGERLMSKKEVMEVIFGKHARYEVTRIGGGLFFPPTYAIYKNGKYHRGSYNSLAAAVEAARREP